MSVPDALLKKTGEVKRYFGLSVAYAKTLRAKATTRKKSAKKNAAPTKLKKKTKRKKKI